MIEHHRHDVDLNMLNCKWLTNPSIDSSINLI